MKRFLALLAIMCVTAFAAPMSADAKIVLQMGIGDPEGSNAHIMAVRFKELVSVYTNGEVEVQLFPHCQLGSEQEMAQNVRLGTLDMALFGSSNLAPFVRTMNVTCFPYLIMSHDDAVRMTTGVSGEILNNAVIKEGGGRILGWCLDGFRRLSNSKRSAATPEEFKGLKIRTPKNTLYLATYAAWNINAVPMAWDETFTALQQGVIDGQDVPYMLFYASKFQEVQKYITDVHFVYIMQQLMISEKKFQSFPKKVQEVLLRAGKESSEYERQHLLVNEAAIREKLASLGIVFVTPKDEEKLWAEPARSVWPKFYDLVGGEEQFKTILKAVTGK